MLEEISLFFLSLSLALAVNTLNEGSTWLPEEPRRPVDDLLQLKCGLEDAELLDSKMGDRLMRTYYTYERTSMGYIGNFCDHGSFITC